MRFDIMTLFPDMVDKALSESIIGRARAAGHISVHCWNIRDFSQNKHRRVDDTPCGGGMGMLMAAPPVVACAEAVLADGGDSVEKICSAGADNGVEFLYMSPRGKSFDQNMAKELSHCRRIVILCGHYEGVDERALKYLGCKEVSVGDYVLTGGELPACTVVDCVSRLCPGVLPDAECYEKESFEDDLLEYPQYTRPVEFRGEAVPEVLLSGHHANINKWRLEQAEKLTAERRPDMYARYLKGKEKR